MKQHLWINGKNVETNTYSTLKSPYSGTVIAEVASAAAEDVNLAIEAAEEAASALREMPAHKRADILEKVASFLERDREDCAKIISNEAAKPIKTARGEVDRTIMTYKFASQEARRIYGETIPMDAAPGGENRIAYTMREPLGIIGAITPFNFPMNLVAHKIGPAIAAGNTVVLKPASQTPLSAYRIAQYFHEAGLPSGALNVVSGSGKTIGDLLVTDERLSMITFTGSPGVGRSLKEKAGLKKVTLELGSNSAVIVDEGTDPKKAAERIAAGAFVYGGQVCISVQRIFVHETLAESFSESFLQAAKNLVTGDPLNEETDLSALISEDDTNRALEWINSAVSRGAQLALGGNTENGILQPTVLLNVHEQEKVSCEEVFAPVVHINSFSQLEDAVNMVNTSKYGLQAGIFTQNIQHAMQAAKKLEVGGVMINDFPTFRVDHMPYGGVKESGTGREGIKYAIEEMTELKLITIKLD